MRATASGRRLTVRLRVTEMKHVERNNPANTHCGTTDTHPEHKAGAVNQHTHHRVCVCSVNKAFNQTEDIRSHMLTVHSS